MPSNVALPPIVRYAKPQPFPSMRLSDSGAGILCGTSAPVPAVDQFGADAGPKGRGVATR
jgi:hypothetical protein